MARYGAVIIIPPVLLAIAVFWLSGDWSSGEGSDNSDSITAAIFGPPDDVSREYAKELLEQHPYPAGEKIPVSKNMAQCVDQYNKVMGGHQPYIQEWRWEWTRGTVTPISPVHLKNIEVSGVRSISETSKIIEYKANHDFGGLETKSRCVESFDLQPRTAVAEKYDDGYDDGWRVKRVLSVR